MTGLIAVPNQTEIAARYVDEIATNPHLAAVQQLD
jgi:hypothetical protein